MDTRVDSSSFGALASMNASAVPGDPWSHTDHSIASVPTTTSFTAVASIPPAASLTASVQPTTSFTAIASVPPAASMAAVDSDPPVISLIAVASGPPEALATDVTVKEGSATKVRPTHQRAAAFATSPLEADERDAVLLGEMRGEWLKRYSQYVVAKAAKLHPDDLSLYMANKLPASARPRVEGKLRRWADDVRAKLAQGVTQGLPPARRTAESAGNKRKRQDSDCRDPALLLEVSADWVTKYTQRGVAKAVGVGVGDMSDWMNNRLSLTALQRVEGRLRAWLMAAKGDLSHGSTGRLPPLRKVPQKVRRTIEAKAPDARGRRKVAEGNVAPLEAYRHAAQVTTAAERASEEQAVAVMLAAEPVAAATEKQAALARARDVEAASRLTSWGAWAYATPLADSTPLH